MVELVEGESVRFLPVLRYKETGQGKRAIWERVWDMATKEQTRTNIGFIAREQCARVGSL